MSAHESRMLNALQVRALVKKSGVEVHQFLEFEDGVSLVVASAEGESLGWFLLRDGKGYLESAAGRNFADWVTALYDALASYLRGRGA